jgi:transcriptional regulator with XRE-family HTH domain
MAKALGRIIQDLREEADLSRSSLARVARMTEAEVWRVENEARPNVRFITIFRLASALGISLDDLAARTGLAGGTGVRKGRPVATAAKLLERTAVVESLLAKAICEVAALKDKLRVRA